MRPSLHVCLEGSRGIFEWEVRQKLAIRGVTIRKNGRELTTNIYDDTIISTSCEGLSVDLTYLSPGEVVRPGRRGETMILVRCSGEPGTGIKKRGIRVMSAPGSPDPETDLARDFLATLAQFNKRGAYEKKECVTSRFR
jgi:hypothetical protein